jgi:hypothetical protein
MIGKKFKLKIKSIFTEMLKIISWHKKEQSLSIHILILMINSEFIT